MDSKHLDVDGLMVYGGWQFKWKTFEKAVKKYGLRTDIEMADILNPSLQREVVKKLIQEDPENWRLWFNCSKKIGFDKKIAGLALK